MHISRAVAGQQNVSRHDGDALHSLLFHVFVRLLLNELLHLAGGSIGAEEAQQVLMAVHGIDHHAGRRGYGEYARHISVGIAGYVQARSLARGGVVAPCRHVGVAASSLGIFVAVVVWIKALPCIEELQRIGLYGLFVVAQPA